jgi:molybdopterin-guanine dinucleotide biosynthesis protein A
VKNPAPAHSVIAGLLLAGGRSTRMGCDKAQLELSGRPLGDRLAATLAASTLGSAGVSPLFLSCRSDQSWTPAGFRRLEDRRPDGGVLAALVDALTVTSAEAAVTVVLAVDLPHANSGRLADFAQRALHGGISLVPSNRGQFEPLAAAWHRSALPVLRETLAQNQSLQAACATLFERKMLCAYQLTDVEMAEMANVNTPADAARVVRLP